jgi:hypothetical protein
VRNQFGARTATSRCRRRRPLPNPIGSAQPNNWRSAGKWRLFGQRLRALRCSLQSSLTKFKVVSTATKARPAEWRETSPLLRFLSSVLSRIECGATDVIHADRGSHSGRAGSPGSLPRYTALEDIGTTMGVRRPHAVMRRNRHRFGSP